MLEVKGMSLTIDMNYILYRNVHILHKTKSLYSDLDLSLKVSLKQLSCMYFYNRIYVVTDSKTSWRKRLYSEYKANRSDIKEKLDIDWEFVYSTYDSFKEYVKNLNKNTILLEADHIEGDDFVFYITKYCNERGYSNTIVSSDTDLNQLLGFSINKNCFINIQYTDRYNDGVIYLPQSYEYFLNELSKNQGTLLFMNQNNEIINYINKLKNNNIIKIINPEKALIEKIISGDTGDNIDSVLKLPTKTNPNNFRGIGIKGAEKIYENYKITYPQDIRVETNEWIDNIIDYITEYKKVNTKEYFNTIKDNILKNRTLIHLHEDNYPKDVIEKLYKIV